MNRGNGYTILEVMIFLAVSGLMIVAAMSAIGGRQQEVQFQQATRDFENKINDLIADVNVGYFERDAGFSCTTSAVAPEPDISYTPTASDSVQGETGDCVLIGKVIVAGDEDKLDTANPNDVKDPEILRIIDMAGSRLVDVVDNIAAEDIEDAQPAPLYTADSPVTTYRLKYGLEVEKVRMYDGTTPSNAANVVAIMNNARSGSAASDIVTDDSLVSGSTSAKIVMSTFDNGVSAINGLSNFATTWRYVGDGEAPSFTSLVMCVSGPNARNSSGDVPSWNHRETAAIIISSSGGTKMVYDGAEDYCA